MLPEKITSMKRHSMCVQHDIFSTNPNEDFFHISTVNESKVFKIWFADSPNWKTPLKQPPNLRNLEKESTLVQLLFTGKQHSSNHSNHPSK